MFTSGLKITPTFQQPKKSPLKLLGFFPSSFLPCTVSRHCILNLEGRNFKGGERRDQTEGEREDGRERRDGERALKNERRKNRVVPRGSKGSRMATIAPLHYVISHLTSSLLLISFHRGVRSPSAAGNKASKHIKLMKNT